MYLFNTSTYLYWGVFAIHFFKYYNYMWFDVKDGV